MILSYFFDDISIDYHKYELIEFRKKFSEFFQSVEYMIILNKNQHNGKF